MAGDAGDPVDLDAPLCALVRDAEGAADAFLARVAERARVAGLRLAGALQSDARRPGRRRSDMVLRDLADGRRTLISEDRGDFAEACRLDAGGLTEAAARIERAIRAAPPDLALFNKFGKAEAEEGRGVRDAIAAALEAGASVLLSVAPDRVAALRTFAGELGTIVADQATAQRWLRRRFGARWPAG
jgi:nucleoside-triphosphatase THEP1